MATSFKVSGLWQATLFKVYSLDFASQRSFEKPKPQRDQLLNLIARKRSAQAEGGGVKERSSRTLIHTPCAVVDGAQRLEGRWIWIKNRGA